MKLLRSLFFSTLASVMVVLFACSDSSAPPPPITPPDTTSHDFTWQRDTLAEFGSTINDVFAISENDAWVVGQFFVKDSTGNVDPANPYNAAYYDGSTWIMYRIFVNLNYGNGQIIRTNKDEMNTVYAPQHKEVWFISSAGGVTKFVNNNWEEMITPYLQGPGSANKIWGTVSDLYFPGKQGYLNHWDGIKFSRIISGYTADLIDIWGTSKDTIYIAAADYNIQSGDPGFLLRIDNGVVLGKEYSSRDGVMRCVWGMNGVWYASGCGPVLRREGNKWVDQNLLRKCVAEIRGTALNNVFIAMEGSALYHYNGSTYQMILPYDVQNGFTPHGLSCVGKSVFLVGGASLPIVIRGTRQ